MTPLSIGIATSTLVSQALGAKQPVQARALGLHGILLAGIMAVVWMTLVLCLRHPIISAYTPNPQVAAAAFPLVTIVAFYHLFDAIQCSTGFVLRGYKITVVPTVIYAVALWGVGLGGGYVAGFDLPGNLPKVLTGASGFWLANMASLVIAAVALLVYWLRISRPGIDAHATMQSARRGIGAPGAIHSALDKCCCRKTCRTIQSAVGSSNSIRSWHTSRRRCAIAMMRNASISHASRRIARRSSRRAAAAIAACCSRLV